MNILHAVNTKDQLSKTRPSTFVLNTYFREIQTKLVRFIGVCPYIVDKIFKLLCGSVNLYCAHASKI